MAVKCKELYPHNGDAKSNVVQGQRTRSPARWSSWQRTQAATISTWYEEEMLSRTSDSRRASSGQCGHALAVGFIGIHVKVRIRLVEMARPMPGNLYYKRSVRATFKALTDELCDDAVARILELSASLSYPSQCSSAPDSAQSIAFSSVAQRRGTPYVSMYQPGSFRVLTSFSIMLGRVRSRMSVSTLCHPTIVTIPYHPLLPNNQFLNL